jgi:hypothetical protein
MQRDPENPDAPAGVLDHGQDVSLGAIEKAGCEEVARQDRLGLGAQEQRPGWPAPPRRGIDTGILQDLPYRRRRDSYSQPGQLPVDPAVAPAGFSRASRRTRALMFRRVAGRSCLAWTWRPSGGGRCRLPAQDRVWGNQQMQLLAAGFRYHAEQGRQECPVRPVQLRAARLLPLQDGELMAQDQDLCGLSMSPHAGRAAATQPAAWSGGT